MTQHSARRQSNSLPRSLFEHLPDALIVCNASGCITRLNAQAETMLGYNRHELLGQSIDLLLPEGLRQFHAAHRAQYSAAPRLRPMGVGKDLYARRKDGSQIPIDISFNPVWQHGEYHVVSIVRDISERKRLELSIRESQRTLTNLMANLPGMAYRCKNDPDRTLEFASNGCLELTGYSAADLVQKRTIRYGHLIHPDDRNRVWNDVQLASLEKRLFELTYRIITARGEEKWVWERGIGIFSPENNPTVLEGFITDISKQKELEVALQNKTAQLETLVLILSHYLATGDWYETYKRLVDAALRLTGSEYGFAGVLSEDGALRILAHAGMAWHPSENRTFYEQAMRRYREVGYLEFTNFENLFGSAITGRRAVLTNDAPADPRSKGIPPGHPPLRSFLGVPVIRESEVVGLVAVANRPGGYTPKEQDELEVLACSAGVLFDNYRRRQHEAALELERGQAERSLRHYASQLKNLSHQLINAREKEQRRVARELHDEIGQGLTGIKLLLEAAEGQNYAFGNEPITAALGLINDLMEKARNLAFQLRPPILDDMGLLPALAWHIKRFSEQTHVHVDFVHNSPERRLPSKVETAAYRIVQEALTNVARHAHTSKASVHLTATREQLFIKIEDHGCGFNAAAVLQSHCGAGLSGMNERASLLGGRLTVDSSPQTGTLIIAELPFSNRLSNTQAGKRKLAPMD